MNKQRHPLSKRDRELVLKAIHQKINQLKELDRDCPLCNEYGFCFNCPIGSNPHKGIIFTCDAFGEAIDSLFYKFLQQHDNLIPQKKR